MSGMRVPANSVWSSMNYTPPRGPCNYKSGIMSGTCPCLRFMLHPVKAATSFECDGCNHHASFHSLANPTEDAILAKWSAQEKAVLPAIQPASISSRNKRKRITAQPHDQGILIDDSEATEGATESPNTNRGFSSMFAQRHAAAK